VFATGKCILVSMPVLLLARSGLQV
jgi:hypothetical protein